MSKRILLGFFFVLVLSCPGWTGHPLDLAKNTSHDLQAVLDISQRILLKANPKSSTQNPKQNNTEEYLAEFFSLYENLAATDLLWREQMKDRRQNLLAAGVSAEVMKRQSRMESAMHKGMRLILRKMEKVLQKAAFSSKEKALINQRATKKALKSLIRALKKKTTPLYRPKLSMQLPFKSLPLAPQFPQNKPLITPAYLDETCPAPVPEDTSAGPDVPLTPVMLEKAHALNQDPIKIFKFVQNEIQTEFYYGSMKGALETLKQKAGNDVDQASLLIALMRASGYAARYVHGTAVMKEEQIITWTGMPDKDTAQQVLVQAGIPFKGDNETGDYNVQRIWVEVYVPYQNYRGARLDEKGEVWIPLDPGLKTQGYDLGHDYLDEMGFDAQKWAADYLSGIQSVSPLAFFRQKIMDYLDTEHPTVSYEQAVGTRQNIKPNPLSLLPGTLPYAARVHAEFVFLPDNLRHFVRFAAEGEEGNAFDVMIPGSELLGHRITLSYVPATTEDHRVVNSFFSLDQTPAYLVKVRPVLKVGGVVHTSGKTAIQMGDLHKFQMHVISPQTTVSIENDLVAGGYYAMAFGPGSELSEEISAQDTEEPGAQLLYAQASDYLQQWNAAEDELSDMVRVKNIYPVLSQTMVGNMYKRTMLFGQPQAIEWQGVFVDADLRINNPVSYQGDAGMSKDMLVLSGVMGSWLESAVLENNLEVEAVSAVKLIQLAQNSSLPIYTVNKNNAGAIVPGLQTDDTVKTDVLNAVQQGWTVVIPQQDFQQNDWTGIGYIVQDLDAGSAGYFISGGIAGGASTQSPEDWVRQDLKNSLSSPHTPPAALDPSLVASIKLIPVTNHLEGIVGQVLHKPIAVFVQNDAGQPVRGSTVTFTILGGGGNFSGNNSVDVLTDHLGIAKAVPTLGTDTSLNPFYIKRPNDTHLSRVGQNIIMAQVRGTRGNIFLKEPFQIFAFPDDPHHLVKVVGDGNQAIAATFAGTLKVRIEDQYNNPVSNAGVAFTVQPATLIGAGTIPPSARNMTIYQADASCSQNPILGECGGTNYIFMETSEFGASVNAILGDTVETNFYVLVEANSPSGPLSQTFLLQSLGHRNYGTHDYIPPALIMSVAQLINDRGEPLNAAEVGTRLNEPLKVRLFKIFDNFEFEDSGIPGCGSWPGPPCYTIKSLETVQTMPLDENEGESAVVIFNPLQGGGHADPAVSMGNGVYQAFYHVGPSPMRNVVEVSANATVNFPRINTHAGTLSEIQVTLDAGQRAVIQQDGTVVIQGSAVEIQQAVYGVQVVSSDHGIEVNADSQTVADEFLWFSVLPLDYHPNYQNIDIYEADLLNWTGSLIAVPQTGNNFVSQVFRGAVFESGRLYRTEPVLNRGSPAEIRGDLVDLYTYTVDPNEVVVSLNETQTARATGSPDNQGTTPIIEWSSDDPNVATVTFLPGVHPSEGTVLGQSTGTTSLTARFTWPSGFWADARAAVAVGKLDMNIFRPPLFGAETVIPDNVELSQGAQTFENLDNDDNDGFFDTGLADNHVTPRDDELVKLELVIHPASLFPVGSVTVDAYDGKSNVLAWKHADKRTHFPLGSSLHFPSEDFTKDTVRDRWVGHLYVEGISTSTHHQNTKLRMTCDKLTPGKDEVALTVLGLSTMTWQGIANSENDDNILRADPNFPSGLGTNAVRVFPGARLIHIPPAPPVIGPHFQLVNLRVELTLPPLEPVNVSFRPFDVDDPTSAVAPVDNESLFEDNRGTVTVAGVDFREGYLIGAPNSGILTQNFTVQAATLTFMTTMQPGDNFRVVGNADSDFLPTLRNDDPLANPAQPADNLRIVHPVVGFIIVPTVNNEIRHPRRYASPVLTVWRKLHVERDSMGTVAGNVIRGFITNMNPNTTATAREVTVTTNLRDGSNDLNSPPANIGMGRFENSTMTVAGVSVIQNIDGNGQFMLERLAGFNITATPLPFTAVSNTIVLPPVMSGHITSITMTGGNSADLFLNITAGHPVNWPAFVGGVVMVNGGIMNITGVNAANSSIRVANLLIPFELVDDDRFTGNVPQPDTSGMADIWDDAFVLPVFTAFDTPNAPFVLNSEPAQHTAQIRGARQLPYSTNWFWAVSVLNVYQVERIEDNDPNFEATYRGFSDLAANVNGVMIGYESLNDWISAPVNVCGGNNVDPGLSGPGMPARQSRYQEVLNHEIGHQFGLEHNMAGPWHGRRTAQDPRGGVMQPTAGAPTPVNCIQRPDTLNLLPGGRGTRCASHFTQISLDVIRRRPKPAN